MSLYVSPNYQTKKALKEAIASGVVVDFWQPGPFSSGEIPDGTHSAEGPHYPQPHKWYAEVTILNGKIIKVK